MNQGTAVTWSGVVSVERPPNAAASTPCRVLSARNIEFNGRRAIAVRLPYSAVRHYFQAEDQDQVFVAASLRDEHLQLHERCNFKEWAHHSGFSN